LLKRATPGWAIQQSGFDQVNESVIPLVELQEKLMKVSELTVSREVFGASYADELYSEWNKLDMILEARTNG
jgi:hypothetical protein